MEPIVIQNDFYQAYAKMKEASDLLKDLGSIERYQESLFDLARYAALSGNHEEVVRCVLEAIENDPIDIIFFFTEKDFEPSLPLIENIVESETALYLEKSKLIIDKIVGLHVPLENIEYVEEKLNRARELMIENSFLESIEAFKDLRDLRTYTKEHGFVTEKFYQKEQLEQKILEQVEAKQAEEVRERERLLEEQAAMERLQKLKHTQTKEEIDKIVWWKKERKERKERARQRKLEEEERIRQERYEEERRVRQAIERKRYEAQKRRRRVIRNAVIFLAITLATISIYFIITNRTRFETIDFEVFNEEILVANEKFVSTYFVFHNDHIVRVKARDGRSFKTPDKKEQGANFVINSWSVKAPDFSPYSYGKLEISEKNIESRGETIKPREKIKAKGDNTIYYANWEPAIFKMKLKGNGIRSATQTVEIPYGGRYYLPYPEGEIPDNVNFLGWSMDKLGGDKNNLLGAGSEVTLYADNFKLYAIWNKKHFPPVNKFLYYATLPAVFAISLGDEFFSIGVIWMRVILLVLAVLSVVIGGLITRKSSNIIILLIPIYIALTFLIWIFVPHLHWICLLNM